MKVLVFGAGALGSLLGAMLAGRHDVTLVGRAPHVEAVQKDGLRIEGVRTIHAHPKAATKVEGDEGYDVIFLTVKAFDTPTAIEGLRPAVGPVTVIVSAQNGLGNYEALKAAFPHNPVLAAVVTYGAMLAGPGRVVYAGQGEILVGGTAKELDSAGRIGRSLREAGFKALGLPDIRGHLWQKVIVNAAINPLAALSGKSNGEFLEDPALQARAKKIVDEAAAVARAQRAPLPERDTFAVMERIAKATEKNKVSMLQDLEKGRRTEIDQINGAIVEAGKAAGIPTPENAAVLAEVKAREGKKVKR